LLRALSSLGLLLPALALATAACEQESRKGNRGSPTSSAGLPVDATVIEAASDAASPFDAAPAERSAQLRDAAVASPADATLDMASTRDAGPDLAAPADAARDAARSEARPDLAPDLPPRIDAPADVPVMPIDAPPERDVAADVAADVPPDLAPDLARDLAPDAAPDLAAPVDLASDAGPDLPVVPTTCGDGLVQEGEACDHGPHNGERCSSSCAWVPFKQLVTGPSGGCGLRTNGTHTCAGTTETFTSIAAGEFKCGLRADASISCWGDFTQPPPAGQFNQVAVGQFACAIRKDQALRCWNIPADPPGLDAVPTGQFLRVAVGGRSACAIRTNGRVVCWGNQPDINQPVPSGTFTDVAVNEAVGACVSRDGKVAACWGYLETPAEEVRAVHVGDRLACGATSTGALCWGINEDITPTTEGLPPGSYLQVVNHGQDFDSCAIVSDGTVVCSQPLGSPTLPPFTAVAPSGGGEYCVLEQDGSVLCTNRLLRLPAEIRFVSLGFGGLGVCGLRPDERLECWDDANMAAVPGGRYRQLVMGSNHACALDLTGAVVCWGASDLGQSVAPPGTFLALSAGTDHTCGLRSDMTVRCWGGGASWSAHPPPSGTFTEVAAGPENNCGTRPDGTVICWGPGSLTSLPAPAGLRQLAVGQPNACGLTSTGAVRCWGEAPPWLPVGPFQSLTAGGGTVCGLRYGEVLCN